MCLIGEQGLSCVSYDPCSVQAGSINNKTYNAYYDKIRNSLKREGATKLNSSFTLFASMAFRGIRLDTDLPQHVTTPSSGLDIFQLKTY